MGGLFSRAFRRLTQGSQSRNQQQESQNNCEQQADNSIQTPRIVTESIPVGQSIDSAEYAALDNTRTETATTVTTGSTKVEQGDPVVKNGQKTSNDTNGAEDEKQGVEEAVIKIQAFVRGHLTRKALKDAHHHSVPPPNALGQSQFDEGSLLRDPPNSIFTQLSLDGNVDVLREPPVTPANSRLQVSEGSDPPRTSLDPIAEAPAESMGLTETITTTTTKTEQTDSASNEKEEQKKLSLICSRTTPSPSQLETPQEDSGTRDSISPVPSEANASIDLTCETPASASIDLMGRNLVPADKMASVLHHKQEELDIRPGESAQLAEATSSLSNDDYDVAQIEIQSHEDEISGTRVAINENGVSMTPDSLESEEAAAIRIQSAFRGYRTRKNSPYRTRSPNSSAPKRTTLRQQEATILDETDDRSATVAASLANGADLDQGVDESAAVSDISESGEPSTERRSSRTRHRDCATAEQHLDQRVPSTDDFTTTEEDTTQTSTVKSVHTQHQNNSHIRSAQVEKPADDLEKENDSSVDLEIRDRISSLDVEGSERNTLEELGLISALESVKTSTSIETNEADPPPSARPSVGSKSEASVETHDTDSSILGAALSLNEDISSADQTRQNDPNVGSTIDQPIENADGLVLESIEEMQPEGSAVEPCAPEDRKLSGAALVEEEEEVDLSKVPASLDEQDQRTIELESDDIERRDPRGQVSEERAKSPQIKLEPPKLGVVTDIEPTQSSEQDTWDKRGEVNILGNENLSPTQGDESGRSSPAFNSSAANSSDEDDSDQAQRDNQSPSSDQANKKPQQPRNKRRNNRNKKKGKK